MKSASILSRAIFSTGLLALTLGAAPLATNDAAQTAADLAQAITLTPDPSSAIQAYARAEAAAPSDVGVETAYLHRMVRFGLPEMADAQATDLTKRNPGDGEAWAVAAYMTAKRNQGGMGTAVGLVEAEAAVQAAPDDLFVLRTAAQLVAWYDVRADKSQTTPQERASVENIRQKLANNAVYAEAYARTTAAYLKMASAPAAGQSTSSSATTESAAPSAPLVQAAPQQYQTYGYGGIAAEVPSYYPPDYVPYAVPYVVAPYDSYWYPDYCYGSGWWWPGFIGGIVIDDDFRHHRDFDGDRDDRRWTIDRSGRVGGTSVPRVASGGSAPAPSWSAPRSYSAPVSTPRYTPAPSVVSTHTESPHLSLPSMGGGGGPGIGHMDGGGGFGGGGEHGGGFGGGGGMHGGGGGGRR